MANINVSVTDGNNIVLSLTPPNTQVITIDRGIAGPLGPQGVSIVSVVLTSGTHAPGTLDTYTINYSNGSTSTFQVYNGQDGTGIGTVTSVSATVPSFLSVTGSPITTSGTLALTYSGTALPVLNGGTGVTTSTGTGSTVRSTSPTLVTPLLGTPTSGVLTNATGLPIIAGTTGTLTAARGGTGATTLTLNNVILGNGTSAVKFVSPSVVGNVLTSDGTIWASAASLKSSVANTWTATQTFNGSTSTFGVVLLDSAEIVNIVAAAPAATTILYVQSGAVQYYTSNASNNFIVNLAFSAGTAMNAALDIGEVTTASLITTQSATAYYGTAVQVDGTVTGVTTRWIGGAPTAGNASGLDTYRFAVIKTAASTYTVLASLTQYKA